MTAAGWVFLTVSWSIVLFGAGWCIRRVLRSKAHWQEPEEEIRKLHHGEFDG